LDSGRICCNDSSGKPYPKPISLPKPPFPPAARAVRANGEVIVTVKIGTDGRVAEAVADSGHPLLRKAAELAAMESRFESSENDSERETKLTYVFLSYVFTPSEKEKPGLKRYSNPCRIEVYSDVDVINYSTY
jgi:outer membrane biosynthesis protein TonB